MTERTKIILDESEIPRQWYNMIPDLPAPPPPPLHPGTGQPAGLEDLTPLFPMGLIGQEVSADSFIDIPEAVLDVYRLWRPTPLYRAQPGDVGFFRISIDPGPLVVDNAEYRCARRHIAAKLNAVDLRCASGDWGVQDCVVEIAFGLIERRLGLLVGGVFLDWQVGIIQ